MQIVGLIQEQHPERCQLFMQWQQMDFPILVDTMNRIGVHAVPLMWAIDEHGVVRKTRPTEKWISEEFILTDYDEPDQEGLVEEQSQGVVAFLDREWSEAISAFAEEIEADAGDADAWFRLGCCYRSRHDSSGRVAGDFQQAIMAWTKALELNPQNYIFRRRVQQYGPRLMKPYPFYTWVEQALREVAARGDLAPTLRVALEGSETALPEKRGAAEASAPVESEPDVDAAIPTDDQGWIVFSGVVAPAPVSIGQNARVYLRFSPDADQEVTWDNEAGVLRVWVNDAAGYTLTRHLLHSEVPAQSSSSEDRSLELELSIPADSEPGEIVIDGYALYFVCSGKDGSCTYLRQDFSLPIEIKKAPSRRRR